MAKPPEIQVRVPRVFCDEDGRFGNPLGVVRDGPSVPEDDRQALATHLGYSETVFIDDAERGVYRIFTPEVELPFAGHPTVGTAWVLAQEGLELDVLRPPAGEIAVTREGAVTWVRAKPEWCPPWELREYATAEEVDALPVARVGLLYAWAWVDEAAGLIRARCFVPEVGVTEDEATGSAALPLAATLRREIEVHQGEGSILFARPAEDGYAEVGGRVVEG
ncbi:MAG: PhzF family phenazine biosynthesis protein [Solirubrobacterales bacterium]